MSYIREIHATVGFTLLSARSRERTCVVVGPDRLPPDESLFRRRTHVRYIAAAALPAADAVNRWCPWTPPPNHLPRFSPTISIYVSQEIRESTATSLSEYRLLVAEFGLLDAQLANLVAELTGEEAEDGVDGLVIDEDELEVCLCLLTLYGSFARDLFVGVVVATMAWVLFLVVVAVFRFMAWRGILLCTVAAALGVGTDFRH